MAERVLNVALALMLGVAGAMAVAPLASEVADWWARGVVVCETDAECAAWLEGEQAAVRAQLLAQ